MSAYRNGKCLKANRLALFDLGLHDHAYLQPHTLAKPPVHCLRQCNSSRCFRPGQFNLSRKDSHEVPCEPRNEFPSLHRIVIPAALRLILAQPLECRWRRWTSLENVFLALQSKHSQDAKAGSNHRLSEAFLSREVGDNPRIKLGEFQFRGGRKTNYFDLELTVRN